MMHIFCAFEIISLVGPPKIKDHPSIKYLICQADIISSFIFYSEWTENRNFTFNKMDHLLH